MNFFKLATAVGAGTILAGVTVNVFSKIVDWVQSSKEDAPSEKKAGRPRKDQAEGK